MDKAVVLYIWTVFIAEELKHCYLNVHTAAHHHYLTVTAKMLELYAQFVGFDSGIDYTVYIIKVWVQ